MTSQVIPKTYNELLGAHTGRIRASAAYLRALHYVRYFESQDERTANDDL